MSLSLKLEDGLPTLKVPPPNLVRTASDSTVASGYSTPSMSAKQVYPNVTRSGALMRNARKTGYLEIR